MKTVTLIIDGKEIEAQVNEEDLKEVEEKIAFGRAKYKDNYYYFTDVFCTHIAEENNKVLNDFDYNRGNYFLTEKECEDAGRVVSLLLQLKRFADEHNNKKSFRKHFNNYYINYDHSICAIGISASLYYQDAFQIYFDSEETAQKAICEFHDELMWYFTEYGKEN